MQTLDEIRKDIEAKIVLASDILKDIGKTDSLGDLRDVLAQAIRLVNRAQQRLVRLKIKAFQKELRREYMCGYMRAYRAAHPREKRNEYWRKRFAARKAVNGSLPINPL
jgi:hypothetical protein